jgi:hypothetical protein
MPVRAFRGRCSSGDAPYQALPRYSNADPAQGRSAGGLEPIEILGPPARGEQPGGPRPGTAASCPGGRWPSAPPSPCRIARQTSQPSDTAASRSGQSSGPSSPRR